MKGHKDHNYRARALPTGLVSCRVAVKETDLRVSAETDVRKQALDLTLDFRRSLEDYIASHPSFLGRLTPWPMDPFAPPLVKAMIEASSKVGTGPMSAVAGAIAEAVGKSLLEWTGQVVVENGGDIFLVLDRPCTVSILAGASPLSGVIGLKIPCEVMPAGVCTSSGTVGHSLSYGIADAVCVVARSAPFADAAATYLANTIRSEKDLRALPARAADIEGLLGVVGVLRDLLVVWGCIELLDLS